MSMMSVCQIFITDVENLKEIFYVRKQEAKFIWQGNMIQRLKGIQHPKKYTISKLQRKKMQKTRKESIANRLQKWGKWNGHAWKTRHSWDWRACCQWTCLDLYMISLFDDWKWSQIWNDEMVKLLKGVKKKKQVFGFWAA